MRLDAVLSNSTLISYVTLMGLGTSMPAGDYFIINPPKTHKIILSFFIISLDIIFRRFNLMIMSTKHCLYLVIGEWWSCPTFVFYGFFVSWYMLTYTFHGVPQIQNFNSETNGILCWVENTQKRNIDVFLWRVDIPSFFNSRTVFTEFNS